MAIVVIPDRICSHCGRNEWYVCKGHTKKGTLVNKYLCVSRATETGIKYRSTAKYRLTRTTYQKKIHIAKLERNKRRKRIEVANLSDSYLKERIKVMTGKCYKDISQEEIMSKRLELQSMRLERKEWTKMSKEEKCKLYSRRYMSRSMKEINDAYIKALIKDRIKRTEKRDINPEDLHPLQIIKLRIRVIVRRKRKSDSYIKNIIQTSIRNQTGDTISFDKISRRKVDKYRKALMMIYYMREYKRLLTSKNQQLCQEVKKT